MVNKKINIKTISDGHHLKKLKELVFQSLLWNSFEAVLYQALLLGHQVALFWVIDRTVYGAHGALFAFLYLVIVILNGSFDTAIIPIFSYCSHKENFKRLLLHKIIRQTLFFMLTSALVVVALPYLAHSLPFLESFTDTTWQILLFLFIVSEGLKKNLRALLHLGFKNRTTALIEVINIFCYISTIWFLYWRGYTLSVLTLTVPFVIVSLSTTLFLSLFLYSYYRSLPENGEITSQNIETKMWINRGYLYLNQLGRTFFSSNFLLPFFACHRGLQETGVASLLNTVTFSLTFFMQKVFAPSGAALFANTKQLSSLDKQSAFSYINEKCFYVICCLVLLFLVNAHYFFSIKTGSHTDYAWKFIYIFFLSHFLENIFILYEKLFAAEEKSQYIVLFNVTSFIGCFLLGSFLSCSSLLTILVWCMVLRLLAFIGLALTAQRLWKLSYTFNFSFVSFLIPLSISLALFLLLHIIL